MEALADLGIAVGKYHPVQVGAARRVELHSQPIKVLNTPGLVVRVGELCLGTPGVDLRRHHRRQQAGIAYPPYVSAADFAHRLASGRTSRNSCAALRSSSRRFRYQAAKRAFRLSHNPSSLVSTPSSVNTPDHPQELRVVRHHQEIQRRPDHAPACGCRDGLPALPAHTDKPYSDPP